MNTETWGKVKAPEPLTLEKLAIEKETVVATYRAVSQVSPHRLFFFLCLAPRFHDVDRCLATFRVAQIAAG